MFKFTISKTKKIILTALLLATFIVLDRFISINTSFIKLSFGLVAIMLTGILLGPKYSILVAGLGDLIGATVILPFGPYFPGFTLNAILAGLIYGFFLYKNPDKEEISEWKFILRIIISNILVVGIINIFITPLWLQILYGRAYIAIWTGRIVVELIKLPIYIVTIYILERALKPFIKKYLYQSERIGIEEYLDKFYKFTKDPTLEAMEYIMDRFDNPHKKVKFVHIAGTNGKGSIAEMINNVLIKSGYKVGKFISPHLISFNDGVCINNEPIKNVDAEEILDKMSSAIDEYNKTHKIKVKWFEVITSLSYIFFAQENCDIAVIETGLGGLTDCTNIIEPLVSVITNIGYDHMDILGDSIEEITKHKAGIVKEGSDTVAVEQDKVTDIINNICEEKNNSIHIIKQSDIKNYKYDSNFQEFDYKDYKSIKINLKGRAQIYNAAECLETIAILKQKGYNINNEDIKQGLQNVIHKARMEVISENPLIVFDGGHNENAIKTLKENIEQYYKDYGNRVYIISVLKTKDYKTIIKNICTDNNATYIFTTGIDKKRYVSKERLYKEAKKYADKNNIHKQELTEAISEIEEKDKENLTLIVGSFYVYKKVCEVLKND